ncbi:hypothetical protein SKB0087_04420 [Anaerococcus nagyae]
MTTKNNNKVIDNFNQVDFFKKDDYINHALIEKISVNEELESKKLL